MNFIVISFARLRADWRVSTMCRSSTLILDIAAWERRAGTPDR
jgi:hypothetical protein